MRAVFRRAAPLLGCLLCLSCLTESTLYMENVTEFATVIESQLVTDAGAALNVTEDLSGMDWKQDGKRFLVSFDILNAQWEIRLRTLTELQICEPLPRDESFFPPRDPVIMGSATLSGGYLNLILGVYKAKGSKDPRIFSCEYKDFPEQQEMLLILHCDGKQENPAFMAKDALETETAYCTIPLTTALKDIKRTLGLVYDKTATQTDGSLTIVADTLRQAGSERIGY